MNVANIILRLFKDALMLEGKWATKVHGSIFEATNMVNIYKHQERVYINSCILRKHINKVYSYLIAKNPRTWYYFFPHRQLDLV